VCISGKIKLYTRSPKISVSDSSQWCQTSC